MSDAAEQVDILIVGAGPTGLTLALALRRLGVAPLLVDRLAEGANTSRAAVIHARTLEVMRDLDVVHDLLAEGVKVPTFRVRDRDRVLMSLSFKGLETAYPFTLMLPQSRTEAILSHHLVAARGGVSRPIETTTMEPDQQGVTVTLLENGCSRRIRAGWVVGCDGARSAVRAQSHISFEGGDYAETFVLADVMMDWPLPRAEVGLFFSEEGLMVVAPLPDDQFRIVATVRDPPPSVDTSWLQAILTSRGPDSTVSVSDILWSSCFHLHHRVAATPLRGRVLLCGDAAHVHSPAGGQGMNTGVQDAASLAPALNEALTSGGITALEEWSRRRHEVARDVVKLTDRMTRLATLRSPVARAMRNAALPLVGLVPGFKRIAARRLAELDY